MQRNKIILALAIGTILSPVITIQAVETTSTIKVNATTQSQNIIKNPTADKAKIEELRARLMVETKILKENLDIQKIGIEKLLAERKGEIKTRLVLQSQEKVRVILDNIFNKFNNQLGKLSEVDIKISAKINALEKTGVNVSAAKAQYALAKASLDKTKSEVMAINLALMEQVTVDTSKETFRDLVKKAEESMKATGKEYNKIVSLTSSKNIKVEDQVNTNIINQ